MYFQQPNHKDLNACVALLKRGSKSFYIASRLLPKRLRLPTAAIYAFCRVSDDAIDDSNDPQAALLNLRRRLDLIYSNQPLQTEPADLAFSQVIHLYKIPRVLPEALLEGYAFDAEGRRYQTLDDLLEYAARVASSVGLIMTLLMGPRHPQTLARAADLGLAMQLTNIARDIGEDARMGRLYLPLDWLDEEGISPQDFLQNPQFSPAIGRLTARLLHVANHLYCLSDEGVPLLPRDCRVSIRAARLIYSQIGEEIRSAGWDSINQRATLSTPKKVALVISALQALRKPTLPSDVPAQTATRFLIEAINPH